MAAPSHEGIGTVRYRSGDDLADALQAIIARVEGRGLRIAEQSRLRRYVPLLRSRGIEAAEWASHANNEADEIVTAVEHLERPPEVAGWVELFRAIQGGPLIPPRHHDPAREAQTELIMGALMRSTGAQVSFEEPDAKAVIDDHGVSFAAKRPTSLTNLQKTFRDGRNQVARSGGTGVVFLDVSALARGFEHVRNAPSAEVALQRYDRALDQAIRDCVEPLVRWVGAEPKRAKTSAAIVALLNARFVVPALGSAKVQFITLRRVHGDSLGSAFVPKWLFEFILRFNRITADALPV